MNFLWTISWMSKNTISMNLTLLWTWCAFFFGNSEAGSFLYEDCCLVSGSNYMPMFHHCYWRWSWSHRWLVPCRQKCDGPSGLWSPVLTPMFVEMHLMLNCPPECIEWSYLITNIMDSLHMIHEDSLMNFHYILQCCICWQLSSMLIIIEKSPALAHDFITRDFQ